MRAGVSLSLARMSLTSSSTLDQVLAEYKANADWSTEQSLAKAKAFVVACRYLLVMRPESARRGTESFEWSAEVIQQQLNEAEEFIRQSPERADSGASVYRTRYSRFSESFRT